MFLKDFIQEDLQTENNDENVVLTTSQYTIALLLMLFPMLGIFISLEFAFGKNVNTSLRNMARAVLVVKAVFWAAIAILIIFLIPIAKPIVEYGIQRLGRIALLLKLYK